MAEKVTIEATPAGPYVVTGTVRLERADGVELPSEPVTSLCRCGRSKTKPFCDGSHAEAPSAFENDAGGTPGRIVAYRGREITVHDNRALCSHSGICLARLPGVFRKDQARWIVPDAADVESVKGAVRACPSGALSFEGSDPLAEDAPARVRVARNGPYEVVGAELRGEVSWGAGAVRGRYALCRCGASRNKPFCDGSHREARFRDDSGR